MLVVVSDLHFEEESTDNIIVDGAKNPIFYSRNLPGKAFEAFVIHLAEEATKNGAKQLEVILAGDIFDLNRTSYWVKNNPTNVRPYIPSNQVNQALESMVFEILDGIKAEPEVNQTLKTFQDLAHGKFGPNGEQEFPVPVTLHYLPGNHDRLANSTSKIRKQIREMLGIESKDGPFSHVLTFPELGAIVRHGHEYDRYNFSFDTREMEEIPLKLPEEAYQGASIGDFVTIDIAARLPHIFRLHHGDEKIVSDQVLRNIYIRLLEFDDLRPQRAILNFLLKMPHPQINEEKVWQAIEPVVIRLLEEIHEDPFLNAWIEKMDKSWRIDSIDLVQSALDLKAWRLAGIPLGLAQFISKAILGGQSKEPGAVEAAAREAAIKGGEYAFVIAGHTHHPAVQLLAHDPKGERYYLDTGTWRNRISTNSDFSAFGRLKALSYAIIYGPDEDLGKDGLPNKSASVDYWSGITQRWSKAT